MVLILAAKAVRVNACDGGFNFPLTSEFSFVKIEFRTDRFRLCHNSILWDSVRKIPHFGSRIGSKWGEDTDNLSLLAVPPTLITELRL